MKFLTLFTSSFILSAYTYASCSLNIIVKDEKSFVSAYTEIASYEATSILKKKGYVVNNKYKKSGLDLIIHTENYVDYDSIEKLSRCEGSGKDYVNLKIKLDLEDHKHGISKYSKLTARTRCIAPDSFNQSTSNKAHLNKLVSRIGDLEYIKKDKNFSNTLAFTVEAIADAFEKLPKCN